MKQKIIYSAAIVVLVAVLGFLWFFIVKTDNKATSSGNSATSSVSSAENGGESGSPPGGGGNANVSYSAVKEITSDTEITSGTYKSESADQNVISASGDIDVTLSGITVNKTGDSDGGDNTSFYGTNSAIIAKDGASLTIKNATIKTDATGANGVFSNGGIVTLNLKKQTASGEIVVDSISSLTINLTSNSSFEGIINGDNKGEVVLTLDKTSTLTLTGDTYVKSLTNKDGTNSNINLNGYKLYVNGKLFTK